MYNTANSIPTPSVAVRMPLLRRFGKLLLIIVLFAYTFIGPERGFPPYVPTLPLLMLGGAAIWWALKIWSRQGLVRSSLTWPFVAILGAATLSTLFSSDPRLSIEMTLNWLVLVLLFFICCDICQYGGVSAMVDILLFVALLVMLQGAYATFQWYQSWYALQVPDYPAFLISFRLARVADYPTQMAALINYALPFAILRLAAARTRIARIGWSMWLLLADTQIFFCHSRSGWLATLALLGITIGWLLLTRWRASSRSIWQSIQAAWRIWGTVLVYMLVFLGLYLIDDRVSASAFSTNSSGTVIQARGSFWQVAWDMFRSHPLFGHGPLTYGGVFFNVSPAHRMWAPPHPHNLFFDIAAHMGLLGIICLLWLVGTAAYRFYLCLGEGVQNTREQQPATTLSQPALCCGAAAALCAYLVQSQFDIISWLPTNALFTVMLCAIGMYAAGDLRPSPIPLQRWLLASLFVPVLLGFSMLRYGNGQNEMLQGISSALQGDWRAAAQDLGRARQEDPNFAFYIGQQAFAYGNLADAGGAFHDPAALPQALQSYAESRAVEPEYVPALLNYAALLDQSGSPDLATQQLNIALKHSGDWALPALLLAERNQSTSTSSNALFLIGLRSEQHAQDMAACRRSAACRAAAQSLDPNPNRLAHLQVQQLLAEGRPQEALAILQGISVNDPDPQIWLDRADTHLALGQLPEAIFTSQNARVLQATRPATAAHAALTAARIALAQSHPEQALFALEQVARPAVRNVEYSYNVFWRVELPNQLLPSLDRLQRTADDLAVYRQLADLYAAAGRTADAAWAKTQGDALALLLEEK